LPEDLAYIWNWYQDVRTGDPMSYVELRAWAQLSGIVVQGWELEILCALDNTRLEVMHDD